ncbi:MAG: O-antigen ligase family protein [Anaerolineales bacterium]
MKRLLFFLSALLLCAALLGLTAVLHQRGVQTFGAVDGLPDPALDPRPDNLRAVNVDLARYTDAELSRVWEHLNSFGWVRQPFTLATYVADPYPEWDRIIGAARMHDKRIIAVLLSALPRNQFASAASEFAARYQDQIDVYQIGDEPNLSAAWGGPPSAAEYVALLQSAYTAIHAADPTAIVLASALAPTIETGPENISDLLYLQQLYDLGAGQYFDAAAGKPYGFYTGPDDRQVDPQILNFSRFTLLREVMVRNGDGHKLLWASNFGWNTLDSSWGKATPEQQTEYTQHAFERAAQEWPWAGPMALENYQPAALADDPRWGFALADPNGQLTTLGQSMTNYQSPITAVPGNYPALNAFAQYTGAWEISDLGADIPEQFSNSQITFSFQGTDLGLRVRRGDYRGYLYVTVDGRPANLLPRDDRGAYLVLTSPTLKPEISVIPVVSGIEQRDIEHTVVIEPERGWDQWAVVGFGVGRRLPTGDFYLVVGGLLTLSVLSATGLWWWGRSLNWDALGQRVSSLWQRLGDMGQLLITALLALVVYAAVWATFDTQVTAFTRRFGDAAPIALTALTAGLFYFSPSFIVAIVALVALFILFYLRLDLALAFIALFIPFFLFPRMLWERGASVLEFSLWLTVIAWAIRYLPLRLANLRNQRSSFVLRLSSIDYGVFALLIVSALSTLAAVQKDVALYEFRTVILGASTFYFLLRATPLDTKAVQRIVDFFILGAVLIAVIGLYQFMTNTNLIVTEEGVARIRSVYGSPNNLGLYLGRALPVALALALAVINSSSSVVGRVFYVLAAVVMGAAIALSFSRGALLLGVPAALAVILIGWQGRRGAVVVGMGMLLALIALPFLAQLPRLAGVFDFQSGTGFFRVNLWLSAWRMFLDHPWLGVGPDNFLYAYRSFYILPAAWQEPNLSHPHNIVMDFLSRLGILGLACAAWLLIGFWRAALTPISEATPSSIGRGGTELRIGLMALVADMLAHGFVDHSFFLVDLAFVFALAAALIQRLRPKGV